MNRIAGLCFVSKLMLWTNFISRDLSFRSISDGYPVLHSTQGECQTTHQSEVNIGSNNVLCHQAAGYHLGQCWIGSMSPHGVTRPQWFKDDMYIFFLNALVIAVIQWVDVANRLTLCVAFWIIIINGFRFINKMSMLMSTHLHANIMHS